MPSPETTRINQPATRADAERQALAEQAALRTTAITFGLIQRMDDIRRANHCGRAICAYETDCECWREFQETLKGQPHAE